MTALAHAQTEAQALEDLHRANLTDGLPVVIPTRERVDQMILAGGLDGDVVLGVVGPAQGAASVETVAVNAVMAGCLPEHFPVVIAAVRAICDEQFDLTEVQVTTHAVTPLLIVNGPAREACGVASGSGALGPGRRGNATIGRALRLVMMNVGGARPGVSDMALFGHPAKFTFCVAEAEESSPWLPLHVARGWRAEQSTVTAVGVEGPHSVVCSPMPEGYGHLAADAAVSLLSAAISGLGSNTTYRERGSIVVIINPAVARIITAGGYDRASLQQALVDRSVRTRAELRQLNPGMIPEGPDEDIVVRRDPESILVLVAGGEGAYALVCPSVGVGPHGNRAVTTEIEINSFCAIPRAT